MDSDKCIEDLVAMLDQFVIEGGGHMNVEVEDSNALDQVEVTTQNSTSCQTNMACQVPTLHQGLDQDR